MTSRTYSPANDLSVQQLRAFCAVFEQESYSAAAREMGLAVPTVWEQVHMANPAFSYEQAYEIEYLAIVPRKHPLAGRSKLRLCDLIRYPLVVGHHETSGRRVLDEALHRDRLLDQTKIAVETDNGAFTAACVRAGLGVGILAGKAGGPLTRDLIGLSLRNQLGNARIVFMWRAGRLLTRATRALMDLVKQRRGV